MKIECLQLEVLELKSESDRYKVSLFKLLSQNIYSQRELEDVKEKSELETRTLKECLLTEREKVKLKIELSRAFSIQNSQLTKELDAYKVC